MRTGGIPNCALGLTGERLSAWRDRLLSTRDMAQITAHLPQCQACQQHLAQFDEIGQQLRNQRELEPRDRIWPQVQMRLIQSSQERNARMKSHTMWSGTAAAVAVLMIIGSFMQVLHNRFAGPASSATTTPSTTITTGSTSIVSVAPFKVTSIDLAVHPTTVTGLACGSTLTVTYTATFHIVPQSSGGTIQFMYTANNGRSSTDASVSVAPGQTTATYSYAVTGTLAADHTFPGIGEAIASSPNSVASPQVYPTGTCTSQAFTVTGIDLAVHPASVTGLACGSALTVTYTATFHIAAHGPGGAIQFMYTWNNGRASRNASVSVAPGQTTATFSYSISGTLQTDHALQGIGEVITSSPNSVTSPQVYPTGTCTSQAFKVTSIDLAVHPTTVTGLACGSTLTVTYTATFHIAAYGPGGTIQFMYTANNGRSSTNASVNVASGQTTATYSYAVTGTLAADHTFPGIGEVIASSPNSVASPQVYPTGTCH